MKRNRVVSVFMVLVILFLLSVPTSVAGNGNGKGNNNETAYNDGKGNNGKGNNGNVNNGNVNNGNNYNNNNWNNNGKGRSHKVSGRITITYSFDTSEIQDVSDWLESSWEFGEEYLLAEIASTQDADKLELLNTALIETQALAVSDFLDFTDDGSVEIVVPVPYAQIVIDGQTVTADADGNYEIPFVDEGAQIITVSYDGTTVMEEVADISQDTIVCMDTEVTSDDINTAMIEMGESMASAQAIRTYNQIAGGTKITGGSCSMLVIKGAPKNYVHCNEASTDKSARTNKNFVASNTDLSKFPANNSDCAISIALGVSAMKNSILAIYYYNSINCAIEAAQAVGRRMGISTSNVYCNTKLKSGNRYNCSWFNGIGHTQELHTHY